MDKSNLDRIKREIEINLRARKTSAFEVWATLDNPNISPVLMATCLFREWATVSAAALYEHFRQNRPDIQIDVIDCRQPGQPVDVEHWPKINSDP